MHLIYNVLIAQLVEHETFNFGVEGSNPSGHTINCLNGENGKHSCLKNSMNGYILIGSSPILGTRKKFLKIFQNKIEFSKFVSILKI